MERIALDVGIAVSLAVVVVMRDDDVTVEGGGWAFCVVKQTERAGAVFWWRSGCGGGCFMAVKSTAGDKPTGNNPVPEGME